MDSERAGESVPKIVSGQRLTKGDEIPSYKPLNPSSRRMVENALKVERYLPEASAF